MLQIIRKYWYLVLITILGITGGFLYWKFIGCTKGSCPITSKWYYSSFTGGILGYYSASLINDFMHKSGS